MLDLYQERQSKSVLIFFFLISILFFGIAIFLRKGPELADDGAFFIRYAENIARGHFWIWNIGEPPVWGASAPLFPLVLAIPIALGFSSVSSSVFVSILIGIFVLASTSTILFRKVGPWAGFTFLVLACSDSGLNYFMSSVLESPLTLALLSMSLWCFLFDSRSLLIGFCAGILTVNKLDLVPVAGLFLLCIGFKNKELPTKNILIAALISASWYLFAWGYFGAPVPNSFLTKAMHQSDLPKTIDWRWFGSYVFFKGIHKYSLVLVFSAFAFLRRFPSYIALVFFIIGSVFVHVIAYTVKYPFEPYNWYCMPSVYFLLVVAALGAQFLKDILANSNFKFLKKISDIFVFLLLAVFTAVSIGAENLEYESILDFNRDQEYDRSEAGRWVNENTPKNFSLFTMWGNPALYAQRMTYDGSFLNRKYEAGDVIDKYRPEILVLENNRGESPMNPGFDPIIEKGYEVVKVFDQTSTHGKNYFFSVYGRKDVLKEITNISKPVNLLKYVSEVKEGDSFGSFKVQDQKTFFMHPGEKLQTSFKFNVDKFMQEQGLQQVKIIARIADISPEAIKRGGGVVNFRFARVGMDPEEVVIKPGTKLEKEFSNGADLEFSVGNNGSADTDWFLLSIY